MHERRALCLPEEPNARQAAGNTLQRRKGGVSLPPLRDESDSMAGAMQESVQERGPFFSILMLALDPELVWWINNPDGSAMKR